MRVLFITNNFPPEVNALATRTFEHALFWKEKSKEFEILTSNPHFPEGKVYQSYKNQFCKEEYHGLELVRVPMYISRNKGTFKRTLSYISFMISCILYCKKLRKKPDIVVASSPQFFTAIAGYFVGLRLKIPFIFELRDLWPESIVAVGAMKRNLFIKFFERVEDFLYKKAKHIVAVTDSFKDYLLKKGVPESKISIIKNGINLDLENQLTEDFLFKLSDEYSLKDKFIVSYIGTIGMAHHVQIMVEAARKCVDKNILFLVLGEGAQKEEVLDLARSYKLKNFLFIPKQERLRALGILKLSDVSLVHLKKSDLFKTVIPSKIFESMIYKKPILLGVEGESERIVVQDAKAGFSFIPESSEDFLEKLEELKSNPKILNELGNNGYNFVKKYYSRKNLSEKYWSILEDQLI